MRDQELAVELVIAYARLADLYKMLLELTDEKVVSEVIRQQVSQASEARRGLDDERPLIGEGSGGVSDTANGCRECRAGRVDAASEGLGVSDQGVEDVELRGVVDGGAPRKDPVAGVSGCGAPHPSDGIRGDS